MPNGLSSRSPSPFAAVAPDEHRSTRLVAISIDSPASPAFSLKGLERRAEGRPVGWGFAWYPEQGGSLTLIKDPSSLGPNPLTKLLGQWERFESTTFLAHLRGAARILPDRDTQPFGRPHGGQEWVFAHNGDLQTTEAPLSLALPLGDFPVHEPIGRSDSEWAFCWLLTQARRVGARRLADVGWARLHEWFKELDALGTANFMVADGRDLVVYADDEDYNPLHLARLVPPHIPAQLSTPEFSVDLEDASDRNRTLVVASTEPLAEKDGRVMSPAQMVVVRRGSFIFDSHADEASRRYMVAPLPSTPPSPSPTQASEQRPVSDQLQASGSDEPPPTQTQSQGPEPPALPPVPQPSPTEGMAEGRPAIQKVQLPIPALHFHARRREGRLLSVFHQTTYRYDKPVERSFHLFRLQPIHDRRQDLLDYEMTISAPVMMRGYADVFGNYVVRADIEEPFQELVVTSRSLVRVREPNTRHLTSPHRRFNIPLVWMPWQRQMMTPYLLPPELPETQLRELSDFAMSFVERQDFDLVQTLLDMNTTIYRDFAYVSGSTTMATTPFEVFAQRRGVCQDFANLLICMARLLGIPARYRVGYIFTGGKYANELQSDASHAWAELYLPWTGWQGFDPTNGILVNADHVLVACGRNFGDATPTSGTIYKGGGGERLKVDVKVQEVEPVENSPQAEL